MLETQATEIDHVIDMAHRVARFFTSYQVFLLLVLIGGGVALYLSARERPARYTRLAGPLVLLVLAVPAGLLAILTNLAPIW